MMSEGESKYARKKGRQMYGPAPKVPEYPNNPSPEAVRERFGDASPVIRLDRDGRPVRRSQT